MVERSLLYRPFCKQNLRFLRVSPSTATSQSTTDLATRVQLLVSRFKQLLNLPRLGRVEVRVKLGESDHGKEGKVANWLVDDLQVVRLPRGKKVTVQWSVGFGWEEVVMSAATAPVGMRLNGDARWRLRLLLRGPAWS
ncbi:hypothetical protein B0A48_17315 [Cryoendolithus antarcticus]|uniref:Uncharacterized protein n=1 Tax=Cryoendolithus antarcticus TaxID=1507870 RepID=A0A1V8SBW1_9PEZI|nr:hypothetical protein B0A48_17315 [Cryoendolithus antarcticus]